MIMIDHGKDHTIHSFKVYNEMTFSVHRVVHPSPQSNFEHFIQMHFVIGFFHLASCLRFVYLVIFISTSFVFVVE